jgi:LPS-assembly protein
MKLLCTALALAALCVAGQAAPRMPPVGAESIGRFSDIPIDIAAEKLDVSGVLSTASGNVQISYGSTTIYADEAQYDPTTRDVIATGDVRIYREGQLVTAERAVYNLETKDIVSSSISGDSVPFMYSGRSFQNNPGAAGYQVKGGLFTTSDSIEPDWSLRARRVRIYPDESIILYDVDFYIGETPVMRLPYVYQALNRENAITVTPGYKSAWGAFLLTNYSFPLTDKLGATLRMDYRTERGFAAGLSTKWAPKEDGGKNWGRFTVYGLNDIAQNTNDTSLYRTPISPGRYRVSLQARQYLTDDIYASVNINKLSDAYILQDFFEGEFVTNPNPDNLVSVTKFADNYTMTLLARDQINEFFNGTERLPEGALDITRQPFFRSKVFYEGNTSAGYYRRHFSKDYSISDYGFTRVDSFHQFSLPQTYFGWLNVVPSVGFRGTWYSQTGAIQEYDATTGQILTTAGQQAATNTVSTIAKNGAVFRPVFNAGLEASFKASKTFEGVQSRAWGLDGMRHIVQPYLNLSYASTGVGPDEILQIDRVNPSSQLPPLDFPAFNSIDAIDNWNILRLGTRNRLQTRRDNGTFNWFEMDSYFDIRFQSPFYDALNSDPGTYSNFVNRIRWNPLPWIALSADAQLPLLDTGFTEINSDLTFLLNKRASISVGHRYLSNNTLLQDSSLINFAAHYRVNENWALSMRGYYENQDHTLESQTYELHRDLTSWVASLGFVARNNGTGANPNYDYGVILTFTLKDLPNVRLPLSFDPSGGSSSGSGVNP